MDKNIYEPQVKLFKALMHPVRLAILDILREGEECVCHMEAILGFRQAYISQHLMILRDAGLVTDRRNGWNIYYRASKPEIYAVIDAMDAICGEHRDLQLEMTKSKKKIDCQCPKCSTTVNAIPSTSLDRALDESIKPA